MDDCNPDLLKYFLPSELTRYISLRKNIIKSNKTQLFRVLIKYFLFLITICITQIR